MKEDKGTNTLFITEQCTHCLWAYWPGWQSLGFLYFFLWFILSSSKLGWAPFLVPLRLCSLYSPLKNVAHDGKWLFTSHFKISRLLLCSCQAMAENIFSLTPRQCPVCTSPSVTVELMDFLILWFPSAIKQLITREWGTADLVMTMKGSMCFTSNTSFCEWIFLLFVIA